MYQNYQSDKELHMSYISEWTQSALTQLRADLTPALEATNEKEIQALLQTVLSTHPYLQNISVSHDQRHYAYSSNQDFYKKRIQPSYLHKEGKILDNLLQDKTHFRFALQEGSISKPAFIYFDLDPQYVNQQLQRHTTSTLISLYAYFLIALGITLALTQAFLFSPLKKIAMSILQDNIEDKEYFLYEPNILNKNIFSNFTRLHQQEKEIVQTLEHQKYLEGILLTIADINQLLIVSRSADELLQKSCIRLAIHGDYSLVWIGFVDGKKIDIEYQSSDKTDYLIDGLDISLDPNDPSSKGPAARSVLENRSVIVNVDNVEKSFRLWQRKASSSGFRSIIALPIRKNLHSQPVGSLVVYTCNPDGFDPKEVSMLEDLAGDIGFATQAFKQDELLKEHLTLDNITKLSNRALLFDKLSKQNMNEIVIIDIDRFKDINEVYGFEVGDFVLYEYARSLEQFLASFPQVELYTMGANTYAFLFPSIHHLNITNFVTLLSEFTDTLVYTYQEIELTVSFTAGHARSQKKCLEHAEMALLKAKKRKESFISFESALLMNQEHEKNILWQKRIKEAIKEDRIVPYFQAIVDNQTQKIVKYEALIRFICSDGEVISPFVFLDISKKTRIYPELTKIMIKKTIQAFEHREETVSINLSLEDIVNPDIISFIRKKVTSKKIGSKLTFEILETEGIENYDEIAGFIREFRQMGCTFSIDDFGSGYSSFEHILKLDVDYLKIDGSLVKNITTDKNSQIIVKHINNFAQDMGLKTIAEFVSAKESYDFVKDLGINYSQGYYFHEPSAEIEEVFERNPI